MSVRPSLLRRVVGAALLLSVALSAACGSDPQTRAAEARKVKALDVSAVPGELHALRVKREKIDDVLEKAKRPYLDAIVLFSLREKEKLQATLQIGQFASSSDYHDKEFRARLLATIGGGTPKELRMSDHRVYFAAGDRQSLAIWFQDRYMYVLATRDDYKYPRGLLRDALEVAP